MAVHLALDPAMVQCESTATVMLKLRQENETVELPGCNTCWKECFENDKIVILSVHPLTNDEANNDGKIPSINKEIT
jgi:hypothetical protein